MKLTQEKVRVAWYVVVVTRGDVRDDGRKVLWTILDELTEARSEIQNSYTTIWRMIQLKISKFLQSELTDSRMENFQICSDWRMEELKIQNVFRTNRRMKHR